MGDTAYLYQVDSMLELFPPHRKRKRLIIAALIVAGLVLAIAALRSPNHATMPPSAYGDLYLELRSGEVMRTNGILRQKKKICFLQGDVEYPIASVLRVERRFGDRSDSAVTIYLCKHCPERPGEVFAPPFKRIWSEPIMDVIMFPFWILSGGR